MMYADKNGNIAKVIFWNHAEGRVTYKLNGQGKPTTCDYGSFIKKFNRIVVEK